MPQFSNVPIGILFRQNTGYNSSLYKTPINTFTNNYIFVGFIPANLVTPGVTRMGFVANGHPFDFRNCDGTTNSYFALFNVLNPSMSSSYTAGELMCSNWMKSSLPHPLSTYMPNEYFYFAEFHQGGCGGYCQSNSKFSFKTLNYYGVAIGVR